ncbi:MAG: DEAD/DEAH box helicase [Desulfovibrionaceae bacterium]|nr:DEAD/DEAH box helicase [Desulfovibrionaceae bacterium]
MSNTESIPFSQGQKVIDKNSPGNIAEYTGKNRYLGSRLMVEIKFSDGTLQLRPASSILAIEEGKINNLLEQMQNGLFGRLSDLRQLITYEKLKGSLHDVIYSMESAQIDFYPYQYKPVIKFIDSPSERLLLADEVGLGKTIEAALIWMEMQARYQAKRLLVICPKNLAEKWRAELQEKFLINAKIVDFIGFREEIEQLKKYGESYPFALISTYSGLRLPKNERDALRTRPEDAHPASSKVELLRELRYWPEEYQAIDLVIFDEAHYMRNQATTTYLLGESLSSSEASRAVLCVSATPVNNKSTDLHSLLKLIDEDFFSTQSSFENLIKINKPAVNACNALAKYPIDIELLTKSLKQMENVSYINTSPYFPELLKKLKKLEQKNFTDSSLLAKCQDITEKMNVLGAYINRTRRIQVQENRPIRVSVVRPVNYAQEEMELYQAILSAVRAYCQKNNSEFHVFQIMTWQLMAASCIPAFVEKIKNDKIYESDSILSEAFGEFENDNMQSVNIFKDTISWSKLLNYDFEKNDSKLNDLYTILKNEPKEKIIIFSYYRGTLNYLQKKLMEIGEIVSLIHGDIPVEKRWDELENFRSPTGSRILLASEVGSEGIDLQFCHILINYDLPWNPMRIEQRIGRIDRVGQTAERLSIINFKVHGTIEERVYERLHQKLEIFSNSIGDLDEVLGAEIKKLTIDLLSKNLTSEEQDKRIIQTQQAIAKKQSDIKFLEESGEGLVALSDYIQKKIEENYNRGRYIQPAELKAYVSNFFGQFFKGTIINYNTPTNGCLQISLSDEAKASLYNFIKEDKSLAATQLRQKSINMTFDREIAQELGRKKKIIFINHMSPFIRWMTKFNKENELNLHKISAISCNTNLLHKGIYIFRIDRWILKGILSKEKLAYGFISLENGECISSYDSEVIFQYIFINGNEWIYHEYDTGKFQMNYEKLEQYMYDQLDEETKDFEIENINTIQIKKERISVIFNRKIEQDKRRLLTMIENNRGEQIINMTRARIKKNEILMENRVKKLDSSKKIDINAEIVALGIVKIEL